jgi:hypothetical protein
MRRVACVVALSTTLVAGCGSHHPTISLSYAPTGGSRASTPTTSSRARIHAAGPLIEPARQLQSSTQLQADLAALNVAQTKGELINALNALRQHYQSVASSHANPKDADWQQALNKLQLTIADVQQLANTNAPDPEAPNPLNPGASSSHAPSAPNAPVPPAPNPVSDIVTNEIKQTSDMLTTVINNVAYAIVVDNPTGPQGEPFGTVHGGPAYPDINCGPAQSMCKGYVLSATTVSLAFDAPDDGKVFQVGAINSAPTGSCNPTYVPTPKPPAPTASCNVSGTAGMIVTIIPHWVTAQPPPNR